MEENIMLAYNAEKIAIDCQKLVNLFIAYFVKDNGLNIENMSTDEFEMYKLMMQLMKETMKFSVNQAKKLDFMNEKLNRIEDKLRK